MGAYGAILCGANIIVTVLTGLKGFPEDMRELDTWNVGVHRFGARNVYIFSLLLVMSLGRRLGNPFRAAIFSAFECLRAYKALTHRA